jgi:hypothetical protein
LPAPLWLRTNRPRPRAVSLCLQRGLYARFGRLRVPPPQKPRAQRAHAARPRAHAGSAGPAAGAGKELPCTVNLQAYPWPAAHTWKNKLRDRRSSRRVRLQVVRHRSCQPINITYGTADSCHHGGVGRRHPPMVMARKYTLFGRGVRQRGCWNVAMIDLSRG